MICMRTVAFLDSNTNPGLKRPLVNADLWDSSQRTDAKDLKWVPQMWIFNDNSRYF